MIPLKLTLTNFLSYHQTTEVDFSAIHLACISGNNGAGKSTLLDAMTWALFGKARRTDDALIYGNLDECEVVLDFSYEGDTYRIKRTRQRGKTGTLDLFIHQPEQNNWHSFSEKSMRETETRIQQILRMDYETFTNASFFLQGKADQFAQQKPGDRKRILGSILGLDIWETYKEKAAEKRKAVESQITLTDGRMAEIRAELEEEDRRKEHLAELEQALKSTGQFRKQQETQMDRLRQMEGSLKEQKKLLDALTAQYKNTLASSKEMETRLRMRQNEKDGYQDILSRADLIHTQYQKLQIARQELEKWNSLAMQQHEIERKMSEPRLAIEKKRASLEQEHQQLHARCQQAETILKEIGQRESEFSSISVQMTEMKKTTDLRGDVEKEIARCNQQIADLRAENSRLRTEMEEMATRREQLEQVHAANCPLCGQDLTPDHRMQVLADINLQGKQKGDAHRANQLALQESEKELHSFESQLKDIQTKENELRGLQRQSDQIQAWLDQNKATLDDWARNGEIRLKTVDTELKGDLFCTDERVALKSFQNELQTLAYDPSAHERVQKEETTLRTSEEEHRQLGLARAALVPLEREIDELNRQMIQAGQNIDLQDQNIRQATVSFTELSAQLPDLFEVERGLKELIDKDNALRQEVGAAKQKVDVLEILKTKLTDLTQSREEQALLAGRYRTLEKAFSKDGVPALLIEQALPEIELQANEILEKLSGGVMRITFLTQRDFKDKSREDKKETLDIQISDINGIRDYEMYSGGEAFRVNFAIRLAMSKVLAQRAGARLQTLVIDEGFGSQDASGRQRLIEAINMVQGDFAKVLVITHLEELKDAFPHRIEVEKTHSGSTVRVIT